LVSVLEGLVFARAAASIVLAGAVVVGTAGCGYFQEPHTLQIFDPGDGAATQVGDIKVLNALGIASEDGETLSLVMGLSNVGDRGITVNLQFEVDGEKVTETRFINGGEIDKIGFEGAEGDQLLVSGAEAELGGLFPLFVQYGNETGKTVLVPIIDGSLPEYENLVPADAEAPTAE
jgi:hypothetical protein